MRLNISCLKNVKKKIKSPQTIGIIGSIKIPIKPTMSAKENMAR